MEDMYYGESMFASARGQRIARCIHCGYEILEDDDASQIVANGGAIHTDCWEEYAADNPEEFLKPIDR